MLKNTQCRQVILNLLEACKHCLTVICYLLIEGSNRLVGGRPPSADIKHRDCGSAAYRPDDAGPGNQRGDGSALKASRGGQINQGIIGCLRHSNLRVGSCHAPLRRSDIRSALQQL